MRYPASEKLEIIRIVEQSHLPAKITLDKLGVARRTFYRWYDRYLEGGPEALEDRPSAPRRVWNRIGDDIQQQIIDMAVQMHGGMGVKKGVMVESLYREIRALRIYEGATEVQQLIIGKDLLKG